MKATYTGYGHERYGACEVCGEKAEMIFKDENHKFGCEDCLDREGAVIRGAEHLVDTLRLSDRASLEAAIAHGKGIAEDLSMPGWERAIWKKVLLALKAELKEYA